jgi:hypothetical protein
MDLEMLPAGDMTEIGEKVMKTGKLVSGPKREAFY